MSRMRIAQRSVLIAGAVLIIIMGLYPPYVLVAPAVRLKGIDYPEKVVAVGYHSIFSPPPGIDPAAAGLLDRTPVVGESLWEQGLREAERLQKGERLLFPRIDVAQFAVQISTLTIAVLLLSYALRQNL